MWIKFLLTSIVTLTLISCTAKDLGLKTIQQQTAGEYQVTVLSDSGRLKVGTGIYFLEFRNASDSRLIDVGKINVAPVLKMARKKTMKGSAEIESTDTAGRYRVTGNFPLSGIWKCTVSFGDGLNVQFNLSAE